MNSTDTAFRYSQARRLKIELQINFGDLNVRCSQFPWCPIGHVDRGVIANFGPWGISVRWILRTYHSLSQQTEKEMKHWVKCPSGWITQNDQLKALTDRFV